MISQYGDGRQTGMEKQQPGYAAGLLLAMYAVAATA